MPAEVVFDYTFTNGTPADAVQVMSNLEELRVRTNESVRGGTGMRMIAGALSSLGVATAGDTALFTASRIGLGHYRITFNAPFSSAAVMTASVINAGASPFNAQVSDPDTTTIDVYTQSSVGAVDVPFSFIAIGLAA